jgi:sodium/hydrogen antiporter
MEAFNVEFFTAALALVGIVILVSALLSGLIERSGLPQVAVFLGLGAALGPAGLGVLNITLDSPVLRVVATLSLALVLFTDAVTLNIKETRQHSRLALRMLGPGSLLSAALIALGGWWLLGLPFAAAAILGAALASTDPVLLRGVLRRRDIPGNARQALQLESGLNDVVLLPVVIIAMAFLGSRGPHNMAGWGRLALELFVLGPGAGIGVGLLAVAALDLVRRRIGVRRDYESLYSLGVAFTAFAAAEAVHGSGFLAAFAAGLTIAALDVELCDCFIEYGGVTAEMALLFTFVLFGSSLIWSGFTVISLTTLLFVAFVLLIRPPVYLASLIGSSVDRRGRLLIAWFGPRGLSSLLLVLLPVFAGVPGSDRLFAVSCLVVLLSVVLHGGSPMLLARAARRRELKEANETHLPESPTVPLTKEAAASGNQSGSPDGHSCGETQCQLGSSAALTGATVEETARASADEHDDTAVTTIDAKYIGIKELDQLSRSGEPVILLDVRTERTYDSSDQQAKGAVRLPPDHVAERARELNLPHHAWLLAYCA